MTYGDFKGLPKRTPTYSVSCDKSFNTAKDTEYNGY